MSSKTSPLAPVLQPELPPISGARLAVAQTGIKYKRRDDLMLVVLEPPATIAATLTTSKTASAPIDICRHNLPGGKASAIIVNAGNANAFTGQRGLASAQAITAAVASATGQPQDQVFIASTGVIGEQLDPAPIISQISAMARKAAPDNWQKAAKAIMTTDTFEKQETITTTINRQKTTLNAIAKGSGMIAPDMATMLVFIFTDASLPQGIAQHLLTQAVNKSFNCITVDSDTSTSDTVLFCATGQQETDFASPDDPRLADFSKALDALCQNLAIQVVRDGEGAEKLITIDVTGARDNGAARIIAMSIANSPLVKTAIAGQDANWGRIVMAVGKAGQEANRDCLAITIGGIQVASNGEVAPGYREADLVPHMQGRDIKIAVDVGIADGSARVWTCDLTHRYIEINADYRS